MIGDPAADAAVASLAPFDSEKRHLLIQAGIEQRTDELRKAPAALRDFFEEIEAPPAWLDPEAFQPAIRAYHQNSDLLIGAHVLGVIVEGFSTLISKSFFMTGRLTDNGVRRLQQNNRHLMEITLPGGLDREGDGWKLSVRIRLVHAQVRRHIRESGEWDEEVFGTPLSMAHIAIASAAFGAVVVEKARMLGVRLDKPERSGYVALWRYVAHLFGVSGPLLFRDYEHGLHLYRVARACEPEPDLEAIAIANSLINSAPVIIGVETEAERRRMAVELYRISRALIGDELADRLRYPKQNAFGCLASMRCKRRLRELVGTVIPGSRAKRRLNNFTTLMQRSVYDRTGVNYRLPSRVSTGSEETW